MDKTALNRLTRILGRRRYVNLYFEERDKMDNTVIAGILPQIKQGQRKNLCIEVDIREFSNCSNEAQEVEVLLKILDESFSKFQLKQVIRDGHSITHVLDQLRDSLVRPSLLILHSFQDAYSEYEKDILRSIRKFIGMEGSILLGILIISNERIDEWALFPESSLDTRFVEFFRCDQE